MLQCVAVCESCYRCVAVCMSCCSVWQCACRVAVCCSVHAVLQCVAVCMPCCSVLQCASHDSGMHLRFFVHQQCSLIVFHIALWNAQRMHCVDTCEKESVCMGVWNLQKHKESHVFLCVCEVQWNTHKNKEKETFLRVCGRACSPPRAISWARAGREHECTDISPNVTLHVS